LTCIDVLSKYAWAVPIKSKSAICVKDALDTIMKKRFPDKLQSDKGAEFRNKIVQSFLKNKGIHFYTSNNEDIKAAVIERFQRTLKGKMWRYFTKNKTRHYLDVLPDLVAGYNSSFHRSIGMQPVQVTKANEKEVWSRLYRTDAMKRVLHKFDVGEKVRINKANFVFKKGYLPSWTEEIYTIAQKLPTSPPTYTIKDYNGEVLHGSFYEPELNVVTKTDNIYSIEKILRKKKIDGETHYLVKWLGYPKTANSYVKEQDLI
jgi:hypothetical protein